MEVPTGNGILDSIASTQPEAAALLRTACQLNVEAGARLQQARDPISFACFPTAGVLSLSLTFEDGSEVHTSAIGCDGAVHACSSTSLDKADYNVTATLPGHVICIEARLWRNFLERNEFANDLLEHYAAFLLMSSQHALACLTIHDVESRLCHWLLKLHAWQDGRPIAITHQGLAKLLGVRRTTVTLIARALQNAGIIAYTRGTIHISDPYALRQASCECHRFDPMWRSPTSVVAEARLDGTGPARDAPPLVPSRNDSLSPR
jgi:CRP-like cAMP-binding protein